MVAASLVLAGAVCLAADLKLFTTGRSWVGSVTTTIVRVTGIKANSLSVNNTGSVRVYAGPNWASTNAFDLALTTITNSFALQLGPVAIAAGDTYVFECLDEARITSFCVSAYTATSTVVINAF